LHDGVASGAAAVTLTARLPEEFKEKPMDISSFKKADNLACAVLSVLSLVGADRVQLSRVCLGQGGSGLTEGTPSRRKPYLIPSSRRSVSSHGAWKNSRL